MKASKQVFILLISVCLCRGSEGKGQKSLIRREAVAMEPTGIINSVPLKAASASTGVIDTLLSKASTGSALTKQAQMETSKANASQKKKRLSGRSTIKGKIEQGGKCLAAKRVTTGLHELELVACSASDDDDEEWEADIAIEDGGHEQIELADDDLCLTADHHHHHVHLRACTTTSHGHHHRQLWTYDNVTNEIKMAVRSHHGNAVVAHKCLASHDECADGTIELLLKACASPTPSHEDWVFSDHLPSSSASSTMIQGKIKQSSKCIAAHKTANADEDLEVVDCGGDGDDDEEWEADEKIETNHSHHSAQKIELESSSGTPECLMADSLFVEVELKPCHTHSHHHRQMWLYDPVKEEIKMHTPHGEKCLESETDSDGSAAGSDGPDDDLVLQACDDSSEQEWVWD